MSSLLSAKMKILGLFLSLLLCFAVSTGSAAAPSAKSNPKPNIIVILVDDMGFSDIGCYGSDIPTPNIDLLASRGVKFKQFYNTARCCPTRAALLTGLYSHQAGMGWMTTDFGPGYPGFRGRLAEDVITIPEVLKPAGYFTAMTGKWHLGPGTNSPAERFDRSLHGTAGGFYYPNTTGRSAPRLSLNGQRIDPNSPELPKNWYSTDLWTDFGLRFIDDALTQKKPFFLYLAHNAPHFPLQADPEDIAMFRGTFKAGWDELNAARYQRQIEAGLIDKSWKKAARPSDVQAWSSLSEADKDYYDHLMAIYAACVWRIDRSVGNLVEGLKKRGVLDDTLILFMSDNGGNAEGGIRGIARGPGPLGSANSTVFSGESWAWLQNTPFRKFKHYVHEGGIATPLIAYWPNGISARGQWCNEPAHLVDIMATCVDLAGANLPARYMNRPVQPLEGVSLQPLFSGKPLNRKQPLFWEHEGNAAARQGDWKAVRGFKGQWELYNLKKDRTEQQNVARANPDIVKDLTAKWDAWAVRANVTPAPDGIGYPREPGQQPTAKTEQRATKKKKGTKSGA
jgi:arylsulfatase A-like enzyme